jgi:hypothetical protein
MKSRKAACPIWATVFASLVGACSVERGESLFEEQTFTDTGAEMAIAPEGVLGEGDGAGTMTGTWLLAHSGSTCVLRQEQLTFAYYLYEIEQDGRFTTETRRLCRADLTEILGLRPITPDVVLKSITYPPVDRGVVSTVVVGGTYSSSTEVALWGLDLDDPVGDPLPPSVGRCTSDGSACDSLEEPCDDGSQCEADPHVVDADGDGKPGVTFLIEGSECRRHVSQRQIVRFNGRFERPNQISGTSLTFAESIIYEASSPLCGISPPLLPNDRHSFFHMYRVDGLGGAVQADTDGDGVVSCEEIEPFLDQPPILREADSENCRD